MAKNSETTTIELRGDREIIMTRIFDAPPELVYKAHTEPEHVREWWGMASAPMLECEIDLRVGGKWRYVMGGEGDSSYAFNGEFQEITPPEKLVYTFVFEPMPDHYSVESLSFEDLGGRTLLTSVSLFDSPESREGMIQSGMEAGARESWDNLEDYLATQS